jgi:histidinol dehydrogenase
MLTSKEISESIEFCENYRLNPKRALNIYQKEKGFPEKPFVMDKNQIELAISKLDSNIKESINLIKKTIDEKNHSLVEQGINTAYEVSDLLFSWQPINQVGVYVPYLLVSSLITWLSSAAAAKSENLTVYLAQDPLTGNPCPASVYAACLYGAAILIGPARFAFPCLAFGDGHDYQGSDLICGPAGRRLNILKQAAALLSNKKADFFAGSSELIVAIDDQKYLPEAILDLTAQMEHGIDSLGYLITINFSCFDQIKRENPLLANRIIYREVNSWQQAIDIIEELAIETVQLFGERTILEKVIPQLTTCGITYVNVSSAKGDYCVVGKGCGDPTQGTARFSSGISPWLFSRLKVVVNESYPTDDLVKAGLCIAQYEKLYSHSLAIGSASLALGSVR